MVVSTFAKVYGQQLQTRLCRLTCSRIAQNLRSLAYLMPSIANRQRRSAVVHPVLQSQAVKARPGLHDLDMLKRDPVFLALRKSVCKRLQAARLSACLHVTSNCSCLLHKRKCFASFCKDNFYACSGRRRDSCRLVREIHCCAFCIFVYDPPMQIRMEPDYVSAIVHIDPS